MIQMVMKVLHLLVLPQIINILKIKHDSFELLQHLLIYHFNILINFQLSHFDHTYQIIIQYHYLILKYFIKVILLEILILTILIKVLYSQQTQHNILMSLTYLNHNFMDLVFQYHIIPYLNFHLHHFTNLINQMDYHLLIHLLPLLHFQNPFIHKPLHLNSYLIPPSLHLQNYLIHSDLLKFYLTKEEQISKLHLLAIHNFHQ